MARRFDDGSTQFLEIDSTPITSPPFAVSAWVRPDVDNKILTVFSLSDKDSAGGQHAIFLDGDGTLAGGDPVLIASRGGSGLFSRAVSSSPFAAATWQHVCVIVAAADDRRVFLDGGSKGTNSASQSPPAIDRISIGRLGDSTPQFYYDGDIAEVGFWSLSPLSGADGPGKADWFEANVLPGLAGGNAPSHYTSGLSGYWPLIDDDNDDSGSGYHLTAFGGPTFSTHPPGIIYPGGGGGGNIAAIMHHRRIMGVS